VVLPRRRLLRLTASPAAEHVLPVGNSTSRRADSSDWLGHPVADTMPSLIDNIGPVVLVSANALRNRMHELRATFIKFIQSFAKTPDAKTAADRLYRLEQLFAARAA
jgi:hypothetical protein